ncbi:deoxyribonuclease IV [Mycoplasma sp. ATU-Cv-703]|uniref:deoxyribonuclease IV n=1 Tax=Mycoplasma sp. ATU-Cv-703 TaxID=2498595 RepID=UPI000FDD512E
MSQKIPQPTIGCHVSFAKPHYLVGAVREALSYGANACMFHLGPPQNARRVSPTLYQTKDYQSQWAKLIPPENLVIHAPYIINPANPEKWEFARDYLIAEIKRMNSFGARYLVLHPGAYGKVGPEVGTAQLVKTLGQVLANSEKVTILLETMAGKGTELGTSLEKLGQILALVENPRLGICFDTCHVWDSGVNIQNVDQLVSWLKKLKLIDKIAVFHINDSKNGLGSRKDRHANLGQGQIGLKVLQAIVWHPAFRKAVMILETPWVDNKPPYQREIALLKGETSE